MAIKATRQPIFGGIEDAPTAASTEYASFFGGNSSNTWATTESWRRSEFPIAGNIINFRVKINAAPGAGKSVTFTVMKNGSAQAMAVTIADAATEGEYTGSISIADGDRISIRCTQTNTPTLFTVASWSTMFEPTAAKRCVIIGGTGNGTGDVASGTTEYQPASGGYTWSTDITLRRTLVAIDGTIRSWNYRLSTSVPSGTTLAVSIYKNGSIEASTTITFTGGGGVTSGGVGSLNIDIAPGDTLAIGCTTTGTTLASAIFGWWGIEVEPDTDGHSQISGMDNSPSTTATEYFFPTNQSNIGSDTVEADRTGLAGVREIFTLSHLRGLLSTAPGAGKNRTLNVRKNSGAGSSSCVIADTNTAAVDSSNSDSFSNTDVISIQMVPSGTPAATTAMLWAARITMNWTSTAVTKGLIYRITREVSAITKGLTYAIATRIFSKDSEASLPTTAANLATLYTAQEYIDVSTDNGVRVGQSGNGDYALHEYKVRYSTTSKNIAIRWNGQSDIAPSTAQVVLQIWNNNSSSWETIASNNSAAADTDFTLAGVITANQSNYYDGSGFISVRVYQLQ